MISRDMYDLLKAIQRKDGIPLDGLKTESKSLDEIKNLLYDAKQAEMLSWEGSLEKNLIINLYYGGIAQIEDYERQMENQK